MVVEDGDAEVESQASSTESTSFTSRVERTHPDTSTSFDDDTMSEMSASQSQLASTSGPSGPTGTSKTESIRVRRTGHRPTRNAPLNVAGRGEEIAVTETLLTDTAGLSQITDTSHQMAAKLVKDPPQPKTKDGYTLAHQPVCALACVRLTGLGEENEQGAKATLPQRRRDDGDVCGSHDGQGDMARLLALCQLLPFCVSHGRLHHHCHCPVEILLPNPTSLLCNVLGHDVALNRVRDRTRRVGTARCFGVDCLSETRPRRRVTVLSINQTK